MTNAMRVTILMGAMIGFLESKGYTVVPGDYVRERDGSVITDTSRFQNEQGMIVTVSISSN